MEKGMMADNWTKLFWRLEKIAKQKKTNAPSGSKVKGKRIEFDSESDVIYFVSVNLIVKNGELICWQKPQKIPLEPRIFDLSYLVDKSVYSWTDVIENLKILSNGSKHIKTILVLKCDTPIGLLLDNA